MLFEPKILVILLFIIINFLIIFVVKTRTTATISLIITHLILVLFLSISIASYQSFKEIILALVVYLMVILSLISNHNKSYLANHQYYKSTAIFLIFIVPAIMICVASFYLAKSTIPIANLVKEKQAAQNIGVANVNLIGDDFSGGGNVSSINNLKSPDNDNSLSNNDYKMTNLKKKLSDNFLLKRSSDVILIIAGFVAGLLLLRI
jgi:hypothetical protein